MVKLNYFSTIKFLSKYILKHKQNFIMFYSGWFVDMLLSITIPILFGIMVNEVVYYQDLDTFMRISLAFVMISLFSCVLYFLIYAQHHYLMSMYTFDIKRDVFHRLMKCDSQILSEISSGEIINNIQWYTTECMHFVVRNIIHLINNSISTIIIILYIFVISWQIGLFAVIAVPASIIINAVFGKKIRRLSELQRNNYGSYISWVYEMLSGILDIRILRAENRVNNLFTYKHKEMFETNMKTSVSVISAQNIIDFTTLFIQMTIYLFVGYLAYKNNMTIGVFTIVLSFYSKMTTKISEISKSYLDAQNRVSFIQHIYDFLNAETEDKYEGNCKLEVTKGSILFNHITFAYRNCNVILNNLTFAIGNGERFALIGKSGSGKTTLAYLLAGFYRPQNGEIIIDGQKLSDCTLKSIRNNIGIISQDIVIFDGSIRYNLLLSNRNATEADIISACKQANIWEYINTLPEGLNTIIGKKGMGLSGGQKQRIAIARIYLKNPKIIIFDEATSSLDSETEEQIHSSWESILQNRTSIIIAHRKSSVMLCNQCALIENGVLVGQGNPQDLMEHNESFKALFA